MLFYFIVILMGLVFRYLNQYTLHSVVILAISVKIWEFLGKNFESFQCITFKILIYGRTKPSLSA